MRAGQPIPSSAGPYRRGHARRRQIAARISQQRRQFIVQRGGNQLNQSFQHLLDLARQRRFELRAPRVRRHARGDVAYPLVALDQHARDVFNRVRDMVVQMHQ